MKIKVTILLLIAGAALTVLGALLKIEGHTMGNVILLIALVFNMCVIVRLILKHRERA